MIKLVHLLYEGRYDGVTTQLSRQLVSAIKSKRKQGDIHFEFPGKKSFTIDDLADLEYSPEIMLSYQIQYKPDFDIGFNIYGEADDKNIELKMIVNPKQLPKIYSDIVPVIKDAIRHELEHVAQNHLARPESERYEKLSNPNSDFFKYLTAKHEVPAFVRGLYKQAKTRRIELSRMFDMFFNDYADRLEPGQVEQVRQVWTDYAKKHLPKSRW